MECLAGGREGNKAVARKMGENEIVNDMYR